MDPVEAYQERIEAVQARYRVDFAALEARWVARRQGVIDRVERAVPGAEAAHEGLIDFLSAPVDELHDAAVADLFRTYTQTADAIRRELGL